MSLNNLNPKIFKESEQDKYFRKKLNKLSMTDYTELMRRYVMKAAKEGEVEMREFDKAIDELLAKGD